MIRFDNVIINIGDFQLTVNMTVQKGFVTVIGHSGAGKSTLLLSLSGHQDLASGKIFVDQNRIDLLPANQRPCSVIFQDFNLFPLEHLISHYRTWVESRYLTGVWSCFLF